MGSLSFPKNHFAVGDSHNWGPIIKTRSCRGRRGRKLALPAGTSQLRPDTKYAPRTNLQEGVLLPSQASLAKENKRADKTKTKAWVVDGEIMSTSVSAMARP